MEENQYLGVAMRAGPTHIRPVPPHTLYTSCKHWLARIFLGSRAREPTGWPVFFFMIKLSMF